jgi:hypothetical protein
MVQKKMKKSFARGFLLCLRKVQACALVAGSVE